MKKDTQTAIDLLKSHNEAVEKALTSRDVVIPRRPQQQPQQEIDWGARIVTQYNSKLPGVRPEVMPVSGFSSGPVEIYKSCPAHERKSLGECPDCAEEKSKLCKDCGEKLSRAVGSAEMFCKKCVK